MKMLGATQWRRQGSFKAPAFAGNAVYNQPRRHPHALGQILQALLPALPLDHERGAGVSGLAGSGSPTAVLGRIRAVVVDPVNRGVGRRLRAKVRHVVCETIRSAPPLADRDSTRPVVRVGRRVWVVASGKHACVGAVSGSARLPMGFVPRRKLVANAAAALGCAAPQNAGRNKSGPTARARALPLRHMLPLWADVISAPCGDGQSAEYLPRKISSRSRHQRLVAQDWEYMANYWNGRSMSTSEHAA